MQPSALLPVNLRDQHPRAADMREEILSGLRAAQKTLPCKYFYDERGSELFDAICELPEYYLTRTELSIMEAHVGDMTTALGAGVLLVEPGSGSSLKSRLLLDHLSNPVAYVPVDISRAHLMDAANRLNRLYADLEVLPVCADFNQKFEIPVPRRSASRTIIYFPGSTIGNFEPKAAIQLLIRLRRLAGEDGGLLIGVDLHKDKRVLENAYNDSAGITAAFNLNLMRRINCELGSDFDLTRFHHHASYNADEGRIEMHLVSLDHQVVRIGYESVRLHSNEHIVTEYSYKHTLPGFAALALKAGLVVKRVWSDDRRWFSVQYLSSV
ncbi:MAG: L-histidine N(alpha)-methyltransferase [Gammaproteobacteria bacterium]|nr:L-histidine N(alpha)-methyltransferase [Gammaproteobacteria bacterium]